VTDSNSSTASQNYSLTLQVGAASGLVFVQAPPTTTTVNAILPAIIVQLVDAGGNSVQSVVSVSLTVPGTTISKTVSTNTSGQATFTGVSFPKKGNYIMQFTVPSLSPFTPLDWSITVTGGFVV